MKRLWLTLSIVALLGVTVFVVDAVYFKPARAKMARTYQFV
jgi:hypothetical protein